MPVYSSVGLNKLVLIDYLERAGGRIEFHSQ